MFIHETDDAHIERALQNLPKTDLQNSDRHLKAV